MSYINHAVNESPTIVGKAGATIADPHLLAVAIDPTTGKLVLPAAGALCLGIALADSDPVVDGDDLHVQIKDITFWKAGGTFKRGDLLAADATGKAVLAVTGNKTLAIALQDGASDAIVECAICRITA